MVPALPPKASFVRLPPHRQIFRPVLSYRLSYTYIILSFTLYHTFAALLYTFYSDTSYIYSFYYYICSQLRPNRITTADMP